MFFFFDVVYDKLYTVHVSICISALLSSSWLSFFLLSPSISQLFFSSSFVSTLNRKWKKESLVKGVVTFGLKVCERGGIVVCMYVNVCMCI